VGPPREPAKAFETPEGHAAEYDEQGTLIGLILMNVRWTLEREGELAVTMPTMHVAAEALEPVLAAA
jgi:hypothetical protein